MTKTILNAIGECLAIRREAICFGYMVIREEDQEAQNYQHLKQDYYKVEGDVRPRLGSHVYRKSQAYKRSTPAGSYFARED